jgi:hypothetical protein
MTLTCLDPLAVEAFSFLAFRELGRCHKKKPQAVYACLGFGGVFATRLLTGSRGSGGWGCRTVGQCAFDEDFLLGKQLHLGMRRSAAYLRAGIEPILRRSISPAETSRYASGEDRLAELSDCGKS